MLSLTRLDVSTLAGTCLHSGQLRLPPAINFALATPELRAQAAALLKCKEQSAYRSGFEAFFNGIEALTNRSTEVTLAMYKRHIVHSLLPMAPYLQGY